PSGACGRESKAGRGAVSRGRAKRGVPTAAVIWPDRPAQPQVGRAPRPELRGARKEERSAHGGRTGCGSGGGGDGGEVVAVGGLLMDLSHGGQSRDAEGRHRA